MPCRDDRDDCRTVIDPETQQRLDKVTRLLCELCGRATAYGHVSLITASKELSNWWDKHQEVDRKRAEAEHIQFMKKIAKEKALNKLTAEEKKLLGL